MGDAETCPNGHPWTEATTAYQQIASRPNLRRYCRICNCAASSKRHDAQFAAAHAGHDVVDTDRLRVDGRPRRRCLTCQPGPDEVVVLRLVQGDPPDQVTAAERRAAVVQMWSKLPVPLIAERVGCARQHVYWVMAAARKTGAAA